MWFGNVALIWFLGGLGLMIVNFIFFRFAIIRKLVLTISSILLIVFGFQLGSFLKANYAAHVKVVDLLLDNGGGLNMVFLTAMTVLLFAVLMSFGDTLLDFEDSTEFSAEGWGAFGIYFIRVSEERMSVGSFFTCYLISTVVSVVVFLVTILWFKWFSFLGILGCIILGFTYIVKPIFIALSNR